MAGILTHKILAAHAAAGTLTPGGDVTVAVDQVLIEDATGTMTAMQFEMIDAGSVAVPLAVMYVDHNFRSTTRTWGLRTMLGKVALSRWGR